MKIKSLIAAAALAAVGVAAHAQTAVTLSQDVDGNYVGTIAGLATGTNDFTLDLSSVPNSWAYIYVQANTVLSQGYDVSGVSIDGTAFTPSNNTTSTVWQGPVGNRVAKINSNDLWEYTADAGLTQGLHTISVTGTRYGSSNGFSGQVTITASPVAPVPEPATVAMMLAGLGVVGFGVRRKRA